MNLVKPIKDMVGFFIELFPLIFKTSICVTDLFLVQSFSWLTIVMFAYWIAFQCLSGLLRPFICMFSTSGQVALLALFGQIFVYRRIKTSVDLENRFVLLYYAIAEGIMMGHLYPDVYLNLVSFCISIKLISIKFLALAFHITSINYYRIVFLLNPCQYSTSSVSVNFAWNRPIYEYFGWKYDIQ
jgi:hypothetical protein